MLRFETGVHPREPVIDLLTLTQLHTASLEDHAKHLSRSPAYSAFLLDPKCYTKVSDPARSLYSTVLYIGKYCTHRLNIELDLRSLFGLLCKAVLIGWDPATSPIPPHLGSHTRALLVSQDRRHLFATTWLYPSHCPWRRKNMTKTRSALTKKR